MKLDEFKSDILVLTCIENALHDLDAIMHGTTDVYAIIHTPPSSACDKRKTRVLYYRNIKFTTRLCFSVL